MKLWAMKVPFFLLCLAGFYAARNGQQGVAGFLFGLAGYIAGLHDGVEFHLARGSKHEAR